MATRKRAKKPAASPAEAGRRTRNGPASRWLPGLPEWEAMKASTRNLSHSDAVRESARLTAQYRTLCRPKAVVHVDLDSVLQAVRSQKVPFVLVGATAIGGWTGRPQATADIDLLVKAGRNHVRAVKALLAAYPQLEVRPHACGTAFFVPGESLPVIHITCAHRADMEDTLQAALWVREESQRYRVPTLEAALAGRFGGIRAQGRDICDQMQDAAHFYFMVRHSTTRGRQPIDLEKLAVLGEKVRRGGGREVVRLVAKVKAGRLPSLAALAGLQ
jgi:hypothetical protein